MKLRDIVLLALTMSHWILAMGVRAETPTYFRRGGGVASDAKPLPERLDAKEFLVWRQALLPGHSTPCIHADRIFLTTYESDAKQLRTVALDRTTGTVRWKQVAPADRIEDVHLTGSPASCTPACDGERVYVFFGSYGLLCYDLDGQLIWSKPMGPFRDEYGAASSPILVDDKVILNEDHDVDSFLIAVHKLTGETVWKVSRAGFTRSYSTPVVWDQDGERQIIVAGPLQLAAYDVRDGRKIWWVNGLSRIVDTTPIVRDGLLYFASWTPGGDQSERISMEPFEEAAQQYDKDGDGRIAQDELSEGPVLTRFFRIDLNQDGALDSAEWEAHAKVFELAENVAMAIRPGGSGNVTDSAVQWRHRRGLPTVPSPVVYGGALYMVKDSGIVTSLDAATGKVLKQGRAPGRGNYYASPVAGDGKVYFASERGVVTVLKAASSWEVLSYHDFGERITATPVIVDGKIFLRTEEALYCFATRSAT